MNRFRSIVLLCCFPFAGCATANLEEGPAWTRDSKLPAGVEFDNYRSANRYHVFVSKAAEFEVQDAYRAAKKNAKAAVTRDVYLGKSPATDEWIPQDIPSRVQEIASWDGFSGERKHAFLLCAYDKAPGTRAAEKEIEARIAHVGEVVAGGVGLKKIGEVEKAFASAEDTMKVLASLAGKRAPEGFRKQLAAKRLTASKALKVEAGRMVSTDDEQALRDAKVILQAVKVADLSSYIRRIDGKLPCASCKNHLAQANRLARVVAQDFDVADMPSRDADRRLVQIAKFTSHRRHACYYFQARAVKAGHLAVARKAMEKRRALLGRIASIGDKLAKSPVVASRERALVVYETGYAHSYTDFKKRIDTVKRTLPCKSCVNSAACKTCAGKRGRSLRCAKCSGNQRYMGTCNGCRGDGKKKCSKCSGSGKTTHKCTKCYRGRVRCGSCRGGRVSDQCGTCIGTGRVANFMSPSGGLKRCGSCGGRGRVAKRCWSCSGSAKVKCGTCGGDARVARRCSRCDGSRRSGTCSKCEGKRRIYYPCRSCREGRLWKSCAPCKGSGQCPTCKGKGHRL